MNLKTSKVSLKEEIKKILDTNVGVLYYDVESVNKSLKIDQKIIYNKAIKQLLTLFSKTIDDVIGEDESDVPKFNNAFRRNNLREQQRARKGELLK